jgi:hypothetical protein
MPSFISRCLQLLAVVGIACATATAMDFANPDAFAHFVSSWKDNEQVATSISKILNDNANVLKSGAASQAFNTAEIACAISKVVFGEFALLDQTAIDSVVEKSW